MKTKLDKLGKSKSVIDVKKGILTYNLPDISEAYLPRCEYHSRFPHIAEMKSANWNAYFRSDMKKLLEVKTKEAKFLGNQQDVIARMYPKIGNFYNPFYFASYKDLVTPSESKREQIEDAYWYDNFLKQKKDLAEYIVGKVKRLNGTIQINADYQYPCVLVEFPKPDKLKNLSISTELAGVFLIAIVNVLAYERGVNIELHRRSSFDHLRPSIAECGISVRVSLGLIPKAYADCIAEGIVYTQKLLSNERLFKTTFLINGFQKILDEYNEGKKLKVELKPTFWDTLWARGDSKGNTFAYQIFRKPIVVEYLINSIMDVCLKSSIKEIFKHDNSMKQTFVTPLIALFNNFKLNENKALTLEVNENLESYTWQNEKVIDDKVFWRTVQSFAKTLGASEKETQLLINHGKVTYLHCYFEHLLKEFTFKPIACPSAEDGCGSESAEEGEFLLNKNKNVTLFAKKMITATGIRAIQLVYAAGKEYLFQHYSIDPARISFTSNLMYYETQQALEEFAIPLKLDNETTTNKTRQNITFFDLNHCNNAQMKTVDFMKDIQKSDVFCVVDITSATTDEMRAILKKLLIERKKLEVVIFVGSGLKNEQGMADYNPYGTIRIFSKNSKSLDLVYKTIENLEKEAEYEHPLTSHIIRKTAKYYGMTPTNESILKF